VTLVLSCTVSEIRLLILLKIACFCYPSFIRRPISLRCLLLAFHGEVNDEETITNTLRRFCINSSRELSQWLCYDDSTISRPIVMVIAIIGLDSVTVYCLPKCYLFVAAFMQSNSTGNSSEPLDDRTYRYYQS